MFVLTSLLVSVHAKLCGLDYTAVDYTAVIFRAHFVAVKCEVFTTTSTREIQLCALPAKPS